jgi:hypothetical protein
MLTHIRTHTTAFLNLNPSSWKIAVNVDGSIDVFDPSSCEWRGDHDLTLAQRKRLRARWASKLVGITFRALNGACAEVEGPRGAVESVDFDALTVTVLWADGARTTDPMERLVHWGLVEA